jgi:hypothetical protein
VFSPEGKHLCTRSDLGHGDSGKGLAWSADGEIAVTKGKADNARVWLGGAREALLGFIFSCERTHLLDFL